MVANYLPDIMQGVVNRVNTFFTASLTDPFPVYYEKGLIGQVKRSVFKNPEKMPLVWLVMKYDESFSVPLAIFSEVNFQMIIAIDTDKDYTQTEREDINYKPRLFPICDRLIMEMHKENMFVTVGTKGIAYSKSIMPYWGTGDVEGADVPNLFKDKYIDAIAITVRGLRIKRIKPKC